MLARLQRQCSIFSLDNKSIQTAAESSIPLALFTSELSAEIQLETRGFVQQPRGQTKHKIR